MIEFLLARRYLFRSRAKHVSFIGVVSCLGIVVGVATVIIAISIVNGVDGGLMERIMRFRPHIVIESFEQDQLYKIRDTIAGWDGVEAAAISAQTQIFGKFGKTIVPLAVKGIDLRQKSERDFFYRYLRRQGAPDGFFIGRGMRRRYDLDDKIEFYALQKKLELKRENIRGEFLVGLYDIDNYCVIADLDKVLQLSPNYRIFLEVRARDPFGVAGLKEKIKRVCPPGVFVSTWIESNESLFATLKLEKLAMFIILTLIILVASFNIFAMLTVKVVEKTKDIGVLKALGFTNIRILAVFSLQGVILGLAGVFLGTGLGLGICFLLKRYPFIKLPPEVFFTEYLPITVNYNDVISIVLVGITICFISSLFPAIRASRLSSCDALRYG